MINKIAEYGSELVYDFSFMYQDNIKPHYNNKRKVSYYLIRDDGYYVSFPSFFHTLPFFVSNKSAMQKCVYNRYYVNPLYMQRSLNTKKL